MSKSTPHENKQQEYPFFDKLLADLDEPLQALTETASLNVFRCYAVCALEKAKRKVKPGMKASHRVHREMLFYADIIDLLERLEKSQGVGTGAKGMIEALERINEDLQKLVAKALGVSDMALDACDEWREQAMEDGPADKRFLHPANLAMRLQRPHKSN